MAMDTHSHNLSHHDHTTNAHHDITKLREMTGKAHANTTRRLSVAIPMPHNTGVVMWDDCQESWQHAVPKVSDRCLSQHPSAGLRRISLTFRMERPELAKV